MSRKSIVANIHRFVRLNDKNDSQVFTFIVPTQLTRGFVNEVLSENFLYRNQSWVVKFDRKERHIGAYLILRSTQNQLSCVIDYSFFVLNRDHFTKNESFNERGCEFSLKKLCRGRPSFIEVADLDNRHFLFDDGKFLIELELRNCATIYEDDINLSLLESGANTLESNYFTFGGCDWSVLLQMVPLKPGENLTPPEFSLVRHSHFEHYCKISYRITLRAPDWPELTASVEQQLDIKGYGNYFRLRSDKPLSSNLRQSLHLSLKLYSMRQLSIVDLMPTSRQKNAARCYDLNQHDWMIQSDILGSVVKLRFFYMQIANVPKTQTHMVCWDAQILPHNPKLDTAKTVSGPYCAYFSQKESDEGTEVATNLIVEQVCDSKSGYVDPESGILTIQIEWIQSHLLTHNHYHIFDNIARTHKSQMSREIKTLQSENYALEKQLYKYQQSFAVQKLSLRDESGQNGSDTASLGGMSSLDYPGQVVPGSGEYQRDFISPQNPRPAQGTLHAAQRRDSSNIGSRSLSPNYNTPHRTQNPPTNQKYQPRESDRNKMVSPPLHHPTGNMYVAANDPEYALDGSSAIKRQLPRNPAEVSDPRMPRTVRDDTRHQSSGAAAAYHTKISPDSSRTNQPMSEAEYLNATRSPRGEGPHGRVHKYSLQEGKEEYDSLASRYENRVSGQKKW